MITTPPMDRSAYAPSLDLSIASIYKSLCRRAGRPSWPHYNRVVDEQELELIIPFPWAWAHRDGASAATATPSTRHRSARRGALVGGDERLPVRAGRGRPAGPAGWRQPYPGDPSSWAVIIDLLFLSGFHSWIRRTKVICFMSCNLQLHRDTGHGTRDRSRSRSRSRRRRRRRSARRRVAPATSLVDNLP